MVFLVVRCKTIALCVCVWGGGDRTDAEANKNKI